MSQSQNTDVIIQVGYGGYVKIDDTFCQVTSANVSKQYNIPTVTPYYQPYIEKEASAKTVIRAAQGTCSFSGEVSFQLTVNTLDLIFEELEDDVYTGFFKKDKLFKLQLFDGNKGVTLEGCMWTSISIQCQPSSMVNCSISFISFNNHNEELAAQEEEKVALYENDDMIPYWQTGSQGMLSFGLSFNRNVTPVYLNNDYITPTYLRPGFTEISLNATYYQPQVNNSEGDQNKLSITIGSTTITFKDAILQNQDFKMSSMNDIGEKTYQWKSIPLDHTKPIFTIEKN